MVAIPLPPPVQEALQNLHSAGHEAYVVGGCVRDAYRGVTPDDWDITTSATPDAVKAAFPHARVIDTGLRHGTVTVILRSMPLEITTYRVDGAYTDHRRPDTVHYTKNLRDDLARRDFTINAIAYAPGEWVDPFGGCADIDARRIRCVGEACHRFTEDALRIMRGLRFRATLGFAVAPDTHRALVEKSPTLRAVAVERLTKELSRMLLGPAIAEVLREYRCVLSVIVPEFEGISGDRWARTAWAMSVAPLSLPIRLAILFRFCGDPGRGLRRLRLDRGTLARAEALIELQDMPLPVDRAALSRALYAHGPRTLLDLLAMREAFSAGGVCAGRIGVGSAGRIEVDSAEWYEVNSTVRSDVGNAAPPATDSTARLEVDYAARSEDYAVRSATDSAAQSDVGHAARPATDSTERPATDSAATPEVGSVARSVTDSTARPATDSTATPAVDSAARPATDSTATPEVDSAAITDTAIPAIDPAVRSAGVSRFPPHIHPARSLVEALIAEDAFTLAALPVRGQDLVERGYRGSRIGEALEALLFAVFDGKVQRERDALLAYLDGWGADCASPEV